MKIKLLCLGKTNFQFVKSGLDEYTNRIGKYVDFDIVFIQGIKASKALSSDEQNKKEGKHILSNIDKSDMVILLDENGKEFTSVQFAAELNKYLVSGRKQIVFVVGGAYGFSDEVYKRAEKKLSLSKMTFSHQIVRLLFVEQFYRAFTILNNEPYHHE
jgi:23S rRNA (pseudouridine1915-N3)-methyltransferase